MPVDFSFDQRIAQRYDLQRAHPPEVSHQVGEAIAALVGQGARMLEIGVGTGRIALPVAHAGCQVVGFDLSADMLHEVPADDLHLLQADMHHLPFVDESFAAVQAVHVLHLARDWQAVLREVARVLEAGGAFIQGDDWMDPEGLVGMMRNELRRHVMELAPDMRPPAAGVSKGEVLAQLGGTDVTEHIAAEWQIEISPVMWLDVVRQRMDPESWILPEAMHSAVVTHLEGFAAATWPDQDELHPVTRRFTLKVTRGPW